VTYFEQHNDLVADQCQKAARLTFAFLFLCRGAALVFVLASIWLVYRQMTEFLGSVLVRVLAEH
jgi:flagellar biogenesis protein FliO